MNEISQGRPVAASRSAASRLTLGSIVPRPFYFSAGLAVLFAVWVWPVPWLSLPPFTAHMAMHMAVVAVAAPLIAWGLASGKLDAVCRYPVASSAIVASMVEFLFVWAWHAPALHQAARREAMYFIAEQGTFLAAGLFLWVAALGGTAEQRRSRTIAGTAGLLFTSMHMTLLGALIALSSRQLYQHGGGDGHGAHDMVDQQLGGVVMLLVGALAYLGGGLVLLRSALQKGRRR